MPKVKRDSIQWKDEIFNFLTQSNISKKNIKRLKFLLESEDTEVVELTEIVYQVACIKPHKKRRLKFLAKNNRELLNRLEETGRLDQMRIIAQPRIRSRASLPGHQVHPAYKRRYAADE